MRADEAGGEMHWLDVVYWLKPLTCGPLLPLVKVLLGWPFPVINFITEVWGEVLVTLVTACPELGTLTIGTLVLAPDVFGTVTNLAPVVVVIVFPVATAFSNFLNLPL